MNGQFLSKQEELDNITFIKTVLMITVVVGHSIAFWNGTWFTRDPIIIAPSLSVLYQWIGSFHLYGFVLAAGYLYSYIRCERGGYKQFLPFVSNKAKRLIVPFFFVLLLWVLPITQVFLKYDLNAILHNMLLAEAPGQLWFLWMLFDVFVIVWPLSRFFQDHFVISALFVICLYTIGFLGGIFFSNVCQIWTALQYMPFFWIGFQLRRRTIRAIKYTIVWVGLDILLFLIDLFIPTTTTLYKATKIGIDFVLHIIGALMTYSVLQTIGNKINWRSNKLFVSLSKYSMPIYLLHQQVIYCSIYLLNGKVNPYFNALINFLLAMCISIVISFLLMKFNLSFRIS
jgi:peptidoglycan/LPS O-acetylase OafA/YrhL